jgi:hypothetical protein
VLPSEQRRVAGREPRSEQRSEGRPAYSAASRVHLHHHRAPTSATQPTDTPPTATQLTDFQVMRSRATGIEVIRDILLIPAPRLMDTKAIREILLTLARRGMDRRPIRETRPIPVPQATDTRAARRTLPTQAQIMDIPCLAIGGRPLEDWSPGAEYAIEPSG